MQENVSITKILARQADAKARFTGDELAVTKATPSAVVAALFEKSKTNHASAPGLDNLISQSVQLASASSGDAFTSSTVAKEDLKPTSGRIAIGPAEGSDFAKRAMDIAIAATALVLLLPLTIMVAILIKVSMGGPVIFRQRRVGQNGRIFECYKFRSMVSNADVILRRLLAEDRDAAKEWHETHKLRHDPRITKFGHLLRKSSLDEIPQLINILQGDMSCVGPRPIVPEELVCYGRYSAEYLKGRPGLTGLWQVSGRSNLDYGRRVKLDRYYVRRRSGWFDIVILAKTIPAVLRSQDVS